MADREGRMGGMEARGDWVASHLRARGLIGATTPVSIAPLAGGVSGEIFEVAAAGQEMVVKRARARLDVAENWFADPGRVITEARALEATRELAPDAVPRVFDLDEERAILVIERAPRDWVEWRSTLFEGRAGAGVAGRLGSLLAIWHRETAADPGGLERFASQGGFEELRLAPFHAEIAAVHPELAGPIGVAVERLREERLCLVHGDFSPKNVLHGEGGAWVLDWEVAHRGAPIFDLAFMLTHLTLKAVHRPQSAGLYAALAADFLGRYENAGGLVAADDPELGLQVGCLLLARVDGKSPAAYLAPDQAEAVRETALGLLRGEPRSEPYTRLWEGSR